VCAVLPAGAVACAQIAGIEETSSGGRSSLAFTRASIGATVERQPLDFNGLEGAWYLVADESSPDGLRRIPAVLGDDAATWTATVPEGAQVMFQLPDYPAPIWRIWDVPNRNLQGLFSALEHPAAELAPPNAMFTLNVTLPSPYAAEERFSFTSVGTWNARSFSDPTTELPVVGGTAFTPPAFAITSATKAPGGRDYEKITTADAVMVLRYVPPKLTGVLEAPPFDQTGNDSIAGTLAAVTDDQTLAVQLAPAAVPARYTPLRPGMSAPTMAWSLNASPGWELGVHDGPSLTSGVAAIDTGTLSVPYGNPFAAREWRATFLWSTSATRTYTPMNETLAITLAAGTRQLVDPTATTTLDLPAPIPEVITLGGMTLSSDGSTIPQPSTPVAVTMVTSGAAPSLYNLELFEILPNEANTALVQRRKLTITSTRPELSIPPEFLEAGKRYNLRAHTVVGGYPLLTDGDLTARELPVASAYMDSGVFNVVAP